MVQLEHLDLPVSGPYLRQFLALLLDLPEPVVPGTSSTATCSALPVDRGRVELLPFLRPAIF